jgi:3-deoxy-7-phosphoheptulonate synthase
VLSESPVHELITVKFFTSTTAQQPTWPDESTAEKVHDELTHLPGLVPLSEIDALSDVLTGVAAGRGRVLQAGECAEDPAECVPSRLSRKAGLLLSLAARMTVTTGLPVTPVGRIAGQSAKPRSAHTERVGGIDLPAYRGPLVNGPERTLAARHHDPLRIDGAHLALLASIANPVACKVGPGLTLGELLELCDRLDPDRTPGRLTLIARLGADAVAERLPALVRAVRDAGHPAIWLCDPMHGNTVRAPDGRKTRVLRTVLREIEDFQRAVTGPARGPARWPAACTWRPLRTRWTSASTTSRNSARSARPAKRRRAICGSTPTRRPSRSRHGAAERNGEHER